MSPSLLADLADVFVLEAEDAFDRDDQDEGIRLYEIAEELHACFERESRKSAV